jgi:uncharacterized membrane protein YkvI
MMEKWSRVMQIAFVYVGTVVGAGFATGKEIVQFFTQYGVFGAITILLSGILFILLGTRMMVMASRLGASSYKQLNDYLFGRTAGSIVSGVMFFVLFGVTSVMLSGAGAVFDEQLGWSSQLGILLTIVFAFLTMLFGLKGILSINTIVVPMMIFFSFSLTAVAFKYIEGISFSLPTFPAFLSPLSYVAFNLAMAQVVLVPLANEVKDERVIRLGGMLGGAFLCLILLSSHISLLTLPNLLTYSIPIAEIVKTSLAPFYSFYLVIIYGEIFTSLVAGIFGLQRQLEAWIRLPKTVLLFIVLCGLYMISLFGYHALLSVLYPLFGYISLLFIFLLFYRKIPR